MYLVKTHPWPHWPLTSDLVESPYAPGGGIGEQLAMEEHYTGDEVESEEHGHRKNHVQVSLRLRGDVGECKSSAPHKFEVSRHWVHSWDQQLQRDQQYSLHGHGDAPVVCAIIDDEQLEERNKNLI